MTKTKTFLSERMFLNDNRSMQGALIGSVTADVWTSTNKKTGKKTSGGYGNARLNISDCNRSVELTFEFESASELQHALKKLSRLASVVAAMQAALTQGHKAIREHKKPRLTGKGKP